MVAVIKVPKGPCIYCCVNNVNGKVYVGSSKNGYDRCSNHRGHLRGGRYAADGRNKHWQASWNKYGEDAFEFFLLEECEDVKKILAEREQHWCDKFQANDNRCGYNSRKVVESNLGMKMPKEFCEKMSEINREIGSRPEVKAKKSKSATKSWEDPEIRAKRCEGNRKCWDNPEYRELVCRKVKESNTQEINEKRRVATQRDWKNPEYRANQIAKRTGHGNFGRAMSQEQKEKIRQTLLVRNAQKRLEKSQVNHATPIPLRSWLGQPRA